MADVIEEAHHKMLWANAARFYAVADSADGRLREKGRDK